MINGAARILESLWLVLSLICLGTGVYNTLQNGFRDSVLFFIFALIALLMYLLRRNMRKNKDTQDRQP